MANGQLTTEQVRKLLASEIEEAKTARAWAKKHGVSDAYICDVLRGRRDPGESILEALGLRKVVKYERGRA